jgi:hypothetical protein
MNINNRKNQTNQEINILNESWNIQWFLEEKEREIRLEIPEFKECKKKTNEFSTNFNEVW